LSIVCSGEVCYNQSAVHTQLTPKRLPVLPYAQCSGSQETNKNKYTARESNTMPAATLRIHIAIGMIYTNTELLQCLGIYSVSQITSPTFLAVTRESIVGFS